MSFGGTAFLFHLKQLSKFCAVHQKLTTNSYYPVSFVHNRYFNSSPYFSSKKHHHEHTLKTEKIQVLKENSENPELMTRDEATTFAKKSHKKLVLVDGDADPYPVYKTVSGKEFAKVESEAKKLTKVFGEYDDAKINKKKLHELHFNLHTDDHDLLYKLKQMKQWIKKKQPVLITVKGTMEDNESMQSLKHKWDLISDAFEDHPLEIQCRLSHHGLKINVSPNTAADGGLKIVSDNKQFEKLIKVR